jgi:hypothetical protein
MNSGSFVKTLSAADLVARLRQLARQSCVVEAEILIYLREVEERKVYRDYAHPSMHAFCVAELGFSECAAYNRITVARLGQRLPAVIEALHSGKVHLTGLRLLAPHLTPENHRDVLAEASGKSKNEIEEIVARLAPQPPVPTSIRTVAQKRPARVKPLSPEWDLFEFTAPKSFRRLLRQGRALVRHEISDGDIASVLELALREMIAARMKKKFAVGAKPRATSRKPKKNASRHIPAAVKREVFERDGGRCTFTDARGRRCGEPGTVQFDHIDGFARTREHRAERMRLLCHEHNQHAADKLYGKAFMDRKRAKRRPARPGTSPNPPPLSSRRQRSARRAAG